MLGEIRAIGEWSRWVESYWEVLSESDVWLPPDGTFQLLYSPAPFVLKGVETERLAPGWYLLLLHQRSLQLTLEQAVWGLRLKAFALPLFLSSPLLEPQRRAEYIALRSHAPVVQHITTRLQPDMSLADRLPLFQLLLQELLHRDQLREGLRDKVNYILFKKGQVSIEEMSKEFGISRQALHKHFVQSLQISPKSLANIWQFNHFLSLIQAEDSLTASALDAGYYDQAHGIRDFKQRLYFPPSQLLKSHNASLDFARQCIQKRFGGEYDPS